MSFDSDPRYSSLEAALKVIAFQLLTRQLPLNLLLLSYEVLKANGSCLSSSSGNSHVLTSNKKAMA